MNKLFSKIAIALASFAMVTGVGAVIATQQTNPVYAEGSVSTLTFSSAPKSGNSYNATQDDEAKASYIWTTDSEYISADNDGSYKSIHTGSGSKTCSYQKYESSSFSSYLIKSVKFRAKSNGSSPICTVSINGESIGNKSLTNSYQDLTITNDDEKVGGNLNVDFTMSAAKKNIFVTYIQVTYVSTGSGGNDDPIPLTNPNPQYNDEDRVITWTKDTRATKYQVKVDAGSYEDVETATYDARELTANEEHTVFIKAVGDETSYTSTEGSVKFTPTPYETHRKFTIASTSSVTEIGDTITNATASYFQTYYGEGGVGQATKDKSMTLLITGLTTKVTISKLVLSMRSNSNAGSGSIAVIIDGNEPTFIAGTSVSEGAGFNSFGDNTSYGNTFRKVTWKDLSFVAKTSIEIKIYCSISSLYCEYFNIYFTEAVNSDYVSAFSVTPSTWSGYTTSVLRISDFTVSATTGEGEGTKDDYIFLGIGHMEDGEFVARDSHFLEGHPQLTDTRLYWKAKYPTTPGGSIYLYAYVTLTVSDDTLSAIAIEGKMDKTSYYLTDRWQFYGLTVNAVYASGNKIDVAYFADITYYTDAEMTNEVASPEALGVGNNQS